MNNFPNNSMYYRHGGRNHEARSSSNVGSGGSRSQFWNDGYSSYNKSADSYRQHNYQSQNTWQHQPFQQQWPHSQWMSSNHQTASFRKDQPHQKHSFKSGHHPPGSYKYKKNFGSNERSTEHKEGHSSVVVKEEDPLPGSEEERKKMLAQETDKVKKCLMTFKNEQSTSIGTSDNKEKGKNPADESYKSKRKDHESTVGVELCENKDKGKSYSHVSGSSQKEREKQVSHAMSTVHKLESHSVNSPGHISSKSVTSSNSTEVSNKHAKKLHSLKHNSNSKGHKSSYSLNSKDNLSQIAESSHLHSSSKPEGSNVQRIKNDSQAVAQQKKNKSMSNVGTKQTVQSDTTKQGYSTTNSVSEGELKKAHLNEDTNENAVQAKIKHLKDRIVRHVLGMSSSHLKDFINKPTSRRYEFAMKHLVKERQELVSREQRGYANSRIHTQSIGSLEELEVQNENTCLDTNVTVNLGSLPPEVIEHLGNLLQVNLLKCVEEPSTSEENMREGYNDCVIDFENLKAFANTLPNNENIFDFIEEKPNFAEIAIKQEVVCPWEEVTESNITCDLSTSQFIEDSVDQALHSEVQENQIPRNEQNFTENTVHMSHSELEENQILQSEQNLVKNIEDHALQSDLQESQIPQNDQGGEVNPTPVSLPQWTDENRFHSVEQHCTPFPDDIDSWNKSVSADLTLQSLELTEKLIDKIEQMTTVNVQNSEVSESSNNHLKDDQVSDLADETDEPIVEEDGFVDVGATAGNNLNDETMQLAKAETMENNGNIEEITVFESPLEIQNQNVPVIEDKQPNQSIFNDPTEIVESQKQGKAVDDISPVDGKDNNSSDAPDIEIITSEGDTTEKDIEIITIPDDETVMETQEKSLDHVERQHELLDNSESKMDIDDSQIEENLNSQNENISVNVLQMEEPQIRSELKTADSFVEVLELSTNDYIQTEEPMEEGALIHDQNLASAIIPETETCEETPISVSPMKSKYLSMPTITEDLVPAPNMNVELGDSEVSGSGLFGQSLNRLDDTARNLVENESEDCKVLKENEKAWSACVTSEIQYSHQGSGNAEFRNLFCELPDLEPEPVDGEQQCQNSVVPNTTASSKPAGSGDAGISGANTGNRSGSCTTTITARDDQHSRFSPLSERLVLLISRVAV